MTKIKCGSVDCKYNDDKNFCRKKSLSLADCYYHTVNEGLQHFWRCKGYAKDNGLDVALTLYEDYLVEKGLL